MNNGVDIICDICPNVKMSLTKTVGTKQSGKQYRMRWFKCPVCGMSDLIKPIEHKGEKFVPIVKLAELASVCLKPSDNGFIIDNEHFEFGCKLRDNYFWYNGKGCFCWIMTIKDKGHKLWVENQIQLFQKLIEWHFDLFDGIKNNEAIDVNTLEENPYK